MLQTIFNIVIIPILGVLTYFIITWLNTKSKQLIKDTNNELANKYIELLNNIITDCVIATNQTYVSTLKEKNSFNAEAQKEAFRRTYEAVFTILTDEAKEHLNEVIGDLEMYVTEKIEAGVAINKNIK